MSAIEASSVRCKTLADGSLDVTLRIEPRDAVAAFTLLSAPGTPVALAALKTAAQAQAEESRRATENARAHADRICNNAAERAKGGEAARWLGIRCGEVAFQQWLWKAFPAETRAAAETSGGPLKDVASDVVRIVCGVKSRAEIDNDPEAFERFDKLIRKPWLQHSGGTA